MKGRGVVLKIGQTLRDLYEERTPLYEKYADLIVNQEQRDVEETIRQIVAALEQNSPKCIEY